MKLSVVTTLYNSAGHIEEFFARMSATARNLVGDDFELVFVNDGSPDNSLEVAVNLAATHPEVVVVDLSRNFGHHKAMMTGLEHALGDKVFLIDSDLEENPEYLTEFAQQMDREDCDVVFGVQDYRKGRIFERWSGEIYYSVFSFFAEIDHPRNISTIRLMKKRYVQALLKFKESEMVISCLWVIAGFTQRPFTIKKHSTSATTYSLRKKFGHLTNAVTSFSAVPLRWTFYIGLMIFAASLTYASILIFNKLILSNPSDGWTSVMVSIWLLGGMIISFIGLVGIYISKVFAETKQRPMSIVKEIYGRTSPN